MSKTDFYVPKLKDKDCWEDFRHLFGGYGWRGTRPLYNVQKIVLHHTVTKRRGNIGTEVEELLQIHLKRGFRGIGYHLVISSEERNGYAVVGYVGDLASIRAHAPNMRGKEGSKIRQGNVTSIGITFVGDHRVEQPTEAMLKSAKLVLNELLVEDARLAGIEGVEDVIGHGYWDLTWCPDGVEGKILKKTILDVITENMGLSHDHPSIQSAISWDKTLKEKASESPLGNSEPSEIITVKNKENLERNANLGEVLLLISRYHYNLRSLLKGELEKKIKELSIDDEVDKDLREAISDVFLGEDVQE